MISIFSGIYNYLNPTQQAFQSPLTQTAQVLDHEASASGTYDLIVEEAIEQLKQPVCSFNTANRIIGELVKYDVDASVKIAEKLPLANKIVALLTIGQFLAPITPERAIDIYESLFKQLPNETPSPKLESWFLQLFLFIAKSMEFVNPQRSKEMLKELSEKANNIFSEPNPEWFLPLGPLCEHVSKLEYNSILSLVKKINGYVLDYFILRKSKKLDLKTLDSMDALLLSFSESSLSSAKVKILLRISENLSEKNPEEANKLFEKIKEIANTQSEITTPSESVERTRCLVLIGEKLFSMGKIEEANQIFRDAEKNARFLDSLDFIAKKIRLHDQTNSDRIFKNLLEKSRKNPIFARNLISIVDHASPSFWQQNFREIHQGLSKSFKPDMKLLYLLKIIDHCGSEKVKMEFTQKFKETATA